VYFIFISIITWYPQGGAGLLVKYNNSLSQALIEVYPEIGLRAHKFKIVPSMLFFFLLKIFLKKMFIFPLEHHYSNKENIKQFFDDFASSNGFDPLIAENWYSVTLADLKKV
jgi:hypothetical protein